MKEDSSEPTPNLHGPRAARLEEREALIAMINTIFRTSVGRPATIASDWAHVYAPENLANVAVICDMSSAVPDSGDLSHSEAAPEAVGGRGKLVASTGVWVSDIEIVLSAEKSAKLRVGGINCVGTLPEYRRHGLGSQVMTAAHETMRKLGCHVGLLHTGISNWYRRMGWEEAGSVRDYRLNRGNIHLLPKFPSNIRVVIQKQPLNPINQPLTTQNPTSSSYAISDDLVRLHNSQRMGATRTLEAFRQLADSRRIEQVAIAYAAEPFGDMKPIAYLLLRENMVLEWAGEWSNVLALVRATYEQLDDPAASTTQRQVEPGEMLLRRLMLQTPGWQQPITDFLDGVAIPYDGDYLGMLTVLDAQGIAAAYGLDNVDIKIEGFEKGSGGEGESLFVVTHQQKSMQLDRRQLTKLFFGPERISEIAHFPLPLWQWHLEMV